MKNVENIIFDFDGTLVDSRVDIIESFKLAINQIIGEKIDTSLYKIGPPLKEIIRIFFPNVAPDNEERMITAFRQIYSNCGFHNTSCYDGIENLLQLLKKKKRKIFLASNKPAYLINTIIKKLSISCFDDICTIDSIGGVDLSKKEMISLLIKKNVLDYDRTIMIGDSFSDIISARENSLISIGVGYGYETKEQILLANPDFYFATVSDLTVFLNT